MSLEDCEQIYRVRVMIECTAIDIIGEQGVTDLGTIEAALASEDGFLPPRQPTTEDMLNYFSAMAGFHNQLVKSCRNQWVVHYHRQLRPSLARYQILYLKMPGTRNASLKEHETVFRFLEKGDFQEAKNELIRHILKTRDMLTQRISDPGQTQ
jgi:DNA-binding GntR family transcriptional regulator